VGRPYDQEECLGVHLGFDKRFRHHPIRYVVQSAIAAIVTMVFLSLVDILTYTGLVAALGATTFLIFTMPHKVSARSRYLVGGYAMGGIAGILTSYAFSSGGLVPVANAFVIGAIAVGVATILMVITNTEHPPAAGMALGLVIQPWDYRTVLYVFGCVCFLCIARQVFKRIMIDLV
jgi:CBS-domain-containing membrane protein